MPLQFHIGKGLFHQMLDFLLRVNHLISAVFRRVRYLSQLRGRIGIFYTIPYFRVFACWWLSGGLIEALRCYNLNLILLHVFVERGIICVFNSCILLNNRGVFIRVDRFLLIIMRLWTIAVSLLCSRKLCHVTRASICLLQNDLLTRITLILGGGLLNTWNEAILRINFDIFYHFSMDLLCVLLIFYINFFFFFHFKRFYRLFAAILQIFIDLFGQTCCCWLLFFFLPFLLDLLLINFTINTRFTQFKSCLSDFWCFCRP